MTEEINVEEGNNQGNSEPVVTDVNINDESAEQTDLGANSETATETQNNNEFSDPNMQADYTRKTQALADDRRAFEAEREKYNSSQADVQKKLDILKRLDGDQEIVDFIYKKWNINQPEQTTQLTDDEIYEAQTDPSKFRELIAREAQKAAQNMVSPISQDLNVMKLESEISNYASTEGNEDFWDLDKSGLIESNLSLLKKRNPRADNLTLIKEAHNQARQVVNSIQASIVKKEQTRVNGIVSNKKNASIDKGGRTSVPSTQSFKGKSMQEIYEAMSSQQK